MSLLSLAGLIRLAATQTHTLARLARCNSGSLQTGIIGGPGLNDWRQGAASIQAVTSRWIYQDDFGVAVGVVGKAIRGEPTPNLVTITYIIQAEYIHQAI